MFKSNLRKLSVKFVILGLLVAILSSFWNSSNEARAKSSGINSEFTSDSIVKDAPVSTNKSCSTCGVDAPQVVYAPIFDLPEANGSEIVFNCRSPHEMEVTPTFYTADGIAVVGEKLKLQPAEIRYVTLKNLIPVAYRNYKEWSGISLSYTGKVLEVWAQLRLLKIRGGGAADVLFTILNETIPTVREAVWFTPQDGYSTIALGNSSAEWIDATLDFTSGNIENVKIAPHTTKLIRHRSIKAQGESVRITELGTRGSLIPTGLVSSANGDYTSSIRFYNPMGAKQPNLYATNLKIKNATPHLMLKNTTATAIIARPQFYSVTNNSASQLELPAITINPNQIIEADLTPLVSIAANNPDFASISVRILNSGSPGSLIGALNSVENITRNTYDAPLRDVGSLRNSTGSYPWRIDGDYKTVVSVNNAGNDLIKFVANIYFGGENYVLDPRALAAGETAVFDLRKIRDEQIPDRSGKTIPRTTTIGQFRWSIYGPSTSRLTGRSEMTSKKEKISSSYSCPTGCPIGFAYGSFINYSSPYPQSVGTDVSALQIDIGTTDPVGNPNPMEWQGDGMGNYYGPYSPSNPPHQLTTGNSSVATPIGTSQVRGVSEGQTTVESRWWTIGYTYPPYGDECIQDTIYGFAVGTVYSGFLSRHAYVKDFETHIGGNYGFGEIFYEPTCEANCTDNLLVVDKIAPMNPSPNYQQCTTLYVSGICLDDITLICTPRNNRGICSN